jgi:hypothetical protein
MSLIKKIKEFFSIRPPQSFVIADPIEVPFHIKELAKCYPILHTVAGNKAVGEIKVFQFNPGKENEKRVGQAHILNKGRYAETWIHLGNDYFKLVMKA